ncbi:helix-turn-helix domain-containing protein [Muricomes intestini]|jgi:excisionase family DNA binding protein|uniref:helix-turn-helix domain-containing protein n=1 Tax=Muricomes intestini TaxID=1796634 RepID=UPI002FDF785D
MEEIMTTQEKRCYTVKDLQEILEISRPTVYELLKRHEFRWIQVGKNYRISKKSFDEWLDQKMENN